MGQHEAAQKRGINLTFLKRVFVCLNDKNGHLCFPISSFYSTLKNCLWKYLVLELTKLDIMVCWAEEVPKSPLKKLIVGKL